MNSQYRLSDIPLPILGKKIVLFVSYGAGHARMLIPVIKIFLRNANFQVYVCGMTIACHDFARAKINYFGFEALLKYEECKEESISCGEKLAKQSGLENKNLVPWGETVAYHGLCFNDLVSEHGTESASSMFAHHGRHSFLPRRTMTKLIQMIEADLVVTTNSPRAERAAIEAAGRLNIPAVCIAGPFMFDEIEWFKQNDYANKICLAAEFQVRLFEKHGRDLKDLVVTGNPAFQEIRSKKYANSGVTLRSKLGWQDKKVILWASQTEPRKHPFKDIGGGDPNLPIKIERFLINLASTNPEWRLIFRQHPAEVPIRRYDNDNVYTSSQEEHLWTVLNACDVLVTQASSVGIDAHLLNKAIVQLQQSIFSNDVNYSELGVAFIANSYTDIELTINTALSQGPRQQSSVIKDAAKNVVKVCIDLLNDSANEHGLKL